MNKELEIRMQEIEAGLATADEAQRVELLEHLDQIVSGLEASGHPVPTWARARLADRIDEAVEEQFDNMPL